MNCESLQENDMRPEYDFTGGIRGKHAESYRREHSVTIHKADGTTVIEHFTAEKNIIVLEEDVQECFPDSATVNKILRSLISLIPKTTPEHHEMNI
jgi:hypothetical protein